MTQEQRDAQQELTEEQQMQKMEAELAQDLERLKQIENADYSISE